MFDVSFSELMLIGVIALIVIGPERLPKVARTLGHLVGRAQRYVSDVKTDIQREMDLEELNNLKSQMQDAAKSVKESMDDAGKSLRAPLEDAQKALQDASASVESLVKAETQANATSDSAAEHARAAAQAVGVEPADDPILVAARAAEAEANLPLPGFEPPAAPAHAASSAAEAPVPGVPPPTPAPGPDVAPPPGVPPRPQPTPEPDVPGTPPPTEPPPEPDVPGVPPGLGAREGGAGASTQPAAGTPQPPQPRSTVSETP